MSSTHRERELKFELPDHWELPDPSRLLPDGGAVQSETQRLESTYYDTAGRDLFGAVVTLRRRTGDADAGWQLKIPLDGARQEIRLSLGAGRGVPAELRTLTRACAVVRRWAGSRPCAPSGRCGAWSTPTAPGSPRSSTTR